MPQLDLTILHVASATDSAAFYARLLGQAPEEASATFALFRSGPGAGIGLWQRDGVEPSSAGAPGNSELAFLAPDVDAVHAEWAAAGVTILQPPTDMDFGRCFTAQDPDGHRLRVFRPG
ncbi:VOC family protein [Roseomonas gilardii subsp. gilardii]|uniref:VOC family protein n=1 Tax=Roseomonas gilardii TaxID=257708 RepID=UPI001FFA5AA9|nr:VOC family protein [Roseomonas gilardii]UPG72803.1 VOC family protein [Roseomonas gilardii subsp. gilardii]